MRRWGFLAGAAILLAGCAHYQLGTGGTPVFATLYVAPVINKALLPQAQAIATSQLRERFERDGRVGLADAPGGADATLEVSLTDYHREIAATRSDDTGLARKFAITLTAHCSLKDNRTGKFLFEDRVISVRKDAFTDNGLPALLPAGNQLQSEYNTFPILARTLADKVAHSVLDVW